MTFNKRWQGLLIFFVLILTVYNILPTVFYYAKPLKQTIHEPQAKTIASTMAKRVNDLEKYHLNWLSSFCDLLNIKAQKIELDPNNPQQLLVTFPQRKDKEIFTRFLPRAGALIPFVPAKLQLVQDEQSVTSKTVTLQRQIPFHFSQNHLDNLFSYSAKKSPDNHFTSTYSKWILDRSAQIASILAGVSDTGAMTAKMALHPRSAIAYQNAFSLAQDLRSFSKAFSESKALAKRYYASLFNNHIQDKKAVYNQLIVTYDDLIKQLRMEKGTLNDQLKAAEKDNDLTAVADLKQKIEANSSKESLLIYAETTIKKLEHLAHQPATLISYQDAMDKLSANPNELTFGDLNPLFAKISIDWVNEAIELHLHPELKSYLQTNLDKQETYNQLIINQIAKIKRKTQEAVSFDDQNYSISFNDLANAKSFLYLDLAKLATHETSLLINRITSQWNPKHSDLQNDVFPICDWNTYQSMSEAQKKLCLVIGSPLLHEQLSNAEIDNSSIYVFAKGLDRLSKKYQNSPNHPDALQLQEDLKTLNKLFSQYGFVGYQGHLLTSQEFANDLIFEKENFYQPLLKATRENFIVKGSKHYALLEFTNREQRVLASNDIETKMHEDLLKWHDDYNTAQVSLHTENRLEVPRPTFNPIWSNFVLSAKKYFRGDERKIINWGLDLSGGKTVQIELRDQNNKLVTDEADLHQGINELYNRVNKMGVSEVNIRKVGSNIVLDFPGANHLSASELVKASSMYFHVINEKFSVQNPAIADSISRFLQDVWNEAVVTNRKDPESINMIAWKHLYGDESSNETTVQSDVSKELVRQGLKLAHPKNTQVSNDFNTTYSKIAVFRGENFAEWHNQTNPLVIVFNNYALEGSSLRNVQAAYDPSKGNYLSFEVNSSTALKSGIKTNPQLCLHNWTSNFAKDAIAGTSLESLGRGQGWRMAVVLNDSVISAPTLNHPIQDRAMIVGNFTQREVNQLAADLKAGSLSFTPKILSEKNVSPELGKQERTKGIMATLMALLAVVFAMISYYRFSGIVASIAVIFNLLFMWATLQNIQATLSLAGIAGIILTVGMAVDANVLVFERIREEFALTGKLAGSVAMGYKKAFNAILDSNVTTIIAALILLNFDAGPIKGFAITLIIGIASSMFSALYMTRYFFMHWVKNPKNQELKMSNLINSTNFNFLKKTKAAFIISLAIMLFGGLLFYQQRHSVFGMDFTGGYSVQINVKETEKKDYRQQVENALIQAGAQKDSFQVRELSPSNQLRLLFSTKMELAGKPFYQMPRDLNKKHVKYLFENNPRILWVIKALQDQNIHLQQQSLDHLDSSWTAMSGQMSDTMRNNAAIGLFLALVAILIYITFRFEFKFAISAMIGLVHDVCITFALIAFMHWIGLPIQIDLHTIAALMTIIGYSLNDTIIIFDRIREDMRTMRKTRFYDVINHALNTTLSRTTITSGTTLLVLLVLIMFGGSTIFGFASVMAVGVIVGTFSSLFIAAPIMLFFHKKEELPKAHRKAPAAE